MKTVEVSFTFKARVDVDTDDRDEALAIVRSSFSMTASSGYHSGDQRVVDWDGEIHPDKELVHVN